MKIVARRLVAERAARPVRLCPMLQPPAVAAPNPIMSPPRSCFTIRSGVGARHLNSPDQVALENAPIGTPKIIHVPQPRADSCPVVA